MVKESFRGRLVAMVGLPASGKTFYVEETLRLGQPRFPGLYLRAGRDHLRTALHKDHTYESWAEDDVTAIQTQIIERGLKANRIVLVDDMNLKPEYRQRLADLAMKWGSDYTQQDFTQVSLDILIQRDAERERSVGADYIKKMHKRYVEPLKGEAMPWPDFSPQDFFSPVQWTSGLPEAILVDIDGTVAKMNGRSPYDVSRVSEDLPKRDVIDQIHREVYYNSKPPAVIFMSGREDKCRADTEEWLYQHVKVPFAGLYMRKTGDRRPDYQVKSELFDRNVKGKFNIRYVLDDRNQVVNMWRKRGLLCLQVADGDF